jgi:hypothetical protein
LAFNARRPFDVTKKGTKPVSLEELWDFEDKHPVIFASPRALVEARLMADLSRLKRGRWRRSAPSLPLGKDRCVQGTGRCPARSTLIRSLPFSGPIPKFDSE